MSPLTASTTEYPREFSRRILRPRAPRRLFAPRKGRTASAPPPALRGFRWRATSSITNACSKLSTSPVHHPPPIYGFTIKNVDDAPVGLPVRRRSFPHMSLPATLRIPVAPWGGVDDCMRQPSRAAIGRSCVHGVVSTACVRSHAQANCVGSAAGRAGKSSRVRTGCDGRSYELAHPPPLLTTDCPWLGLRR
jgi:hypothetical protein